MTPNRRPLVCAAWFAAALPLGSCMVAPQVRVEPPPPPTVALTGPAIAFVPAEAAAPPVVAPAAPTTPMPALPAGPVAQEQMALAAPPAGPLTIAPGDLRGMAREDVAALLGAPDLDRRDGNAEALLYSGAGCVLHVFLYPPPAGGAFRVEYAELGPDNRDKNADAVCLRGLRQRGILAAK